jgi:DNA helicase-2/ATP-dependent DNA helicase PcrA
MNMSNENTDGKNKYFELLNERQAEAVRSTEGFVRIIAGAGSGKTRVLANRYAYIVEELGIPASNLLCLTFTNRAAKEMKNRIKKLLESEGVNDFICTFHGFCVRLLREDIPKIQYPATFSIIDTEDQKEILREIYSDLKMRPPKISFQETLKAIHDYKIKTPYIENYLLPSEPDPLPEDADLVLKVITGYIRIQRRNFLLDFDDLISLTLYLFDHFPDVLKKWQAKLEYVMIDETQDNSDRQWKMADLLSGESKNLFIVGDPDQSIYAWRGAKPEYLVDFDQSHIPCKTIILDQNYRSNKRILDIANSLIRKNHHRINKNLFTNSLEEGAALHFHGKKEEMESTWVTEKIKAKIRDGYDINEIAVLYRAAHISRPFEQALIAKEIPYIIYGGIRFFERREIKDILAYLRLIATGDDISFMRIINRPSRKMGKKFIQNLQMSALNATETLYETLKRLVVSGEIDKKETVNFINLIEYCREKFPQTAISNLVQGVLELSGLLEEIKQDGDEDRLDNLAELMQSIKNYENDHRHEEVNSLQQYLQDIALYTNIDYKDDTSVLKLMTIHQAKGLEFGTVFIVGMTEGIFPNHRSIRENGQAALEEERRLAYVAITRAKSELYITESEGFSHESIEKYPSSFIYEITPETLLDRKGFVSPDLRKGTEQLIRQLKAFVAEKQSIESGTTVSHPVFGNGRIISSDGNEYRVFFNSLQKEKNINKYFKGLTVENDKAIEPEATTEEGQNIVERRGKWSKEGIPHKGWVCIDIEDMGYPAITCEMCEFQIIRYVHYMKHKEYPEILKVGCICAGNMEGDLVNARKRDDFMRSRSDKRKRWLTLKKWKISKKGNGWIKADGYIVVMKYRNPYWSALIRNDESTPRFEQWIQRKYKSQNEAKLAAFDFLTKILAEKGN